MKNARIIVFLIVVVIILVSLSIGIRIYNNQNKETPNIYEGSIGSSIKKEDFSYKKIANATVMASKESDNLISSDATFQISFDENVTREYVEHIYSFSPMIGYNVEEKDSKTYVLKPICELDSNKLYNVVEKTEDGIKKWAFQTNNDFKVSYAYPNNYLYKSNTNVEISFNSDLADNQNLNEYIRIEPPIDGYWDNEKYKNTLYFYHPNEEFLNGENYVVILKEGLRDSNGNVLKDDYRFGFKVNYSSSDVGVDSTFLLSENLFKLNTNISFEAVMNFYYKTEKYSVKDSNLKIFEVGSKNKFLALLEEYNLNKNLPNQLYYSGEEYNLVYEKDCSKYEELASDTIYKQVKICNIETDFASNKAGYYFAIIKLDNYYAMKLFQINDNMSSFSILDTGEIFSLFKNADNSNNEVEVYLNNSKIGKTNKDGVLYLEDIPNYENILKSDFNFIEFKSEDPIILDITSAIYDTRYQIENPTTFSRFSNGYLYTDRHYYKVGEEINFFGYARNRVYDVKNATLVIEANDREIFRTELELDSLGAFTYKYKIDDITQGSRLYAHLLINGIRAYSIYDISIVDYSISQYNVNVETNENTLVAGDETLVNISAKTYDDTPLINVPFKFVRKDDNKSIISSNQDVYTNSTGEAVGKISFSLNNEPSNVERPHYITYRVENNMLDGGSTEIYYNIYEYKNRANVDINYDEVKNEFVININEYEVKNKNKPANDKITINAYAKYVTRDFVRTEINEYTRQQEKIYETRYNPKSEEDKTFEVEVKDGKATLTVPNWSDTKNEKGYYIFNVYLNNNENKILTYSEYESNYYRVYDYYSVKENSNNIKIERTIKKNKIPYYDLYTESLPKKFGDKALYELREKDIYNPHYLFWDDENSSRKTKKLSGDKALDDYSNIEIYTVLISGKGVQILDFKNKPVEFSIDEENGFNYAFYPVIFDGEKIYSPYFSTWSGQIETQSKYRYFIKNILDTEEKLLDIDISFDKEKYSPGDFAEIKIKTSHNGIGEQSAVNLSAVDQAYLDENGYQYVRICNSVENYYSYSANEISSNLYIPITTYDEAGGGGGGDGSPRDDILTTAFFEKVITDKNGEATIKVKLPDNITNWVVTTQAISNIYRANYRLDNLTTTLPYYVGLNLKDSYIEDEKFAFVVKSFGDGLYGKDTNYKVYILDDLDKELEMDELSSKVGDAISYKIKNGLKVGNYKIKLEGTCENKKDSLLMDFKVKKAGLEIKYREDVSGDLDIKAPQATLIALNKDVSKIYDTLIFLADLKNGSRNDSKIIGKEAQRILNALSNNTVYEKGNGKTNYTNPQILKVFDNDGNNAMLGLRNFATNCVSWTYVEWTDQKAVEYIRQEEGEYAKLWANASQGEAVLPFAREEFKNVKDNTLDYTKKDALYVALALAELGDFDNAKELYDVLKDQVKDDDIEFELLVTLSIKLNLEDRDTLYNKFLSYGYKPEIENYIKLYYVQNEVSRNFSQGTIKLMENGETIDIKTKNIGYTKYPLTNKSTYRIVDADDNLKLMVEDYKELDISKIDKLNVISKSYNSTPVLGENTRVTLKINAKEIYNKFGKGTYYIQDVVPNNLGFIDYLPAFSSRYSYYSGKDGQKLSFSISVNDYSTEEEKIVYDVRMTNDGDMIETGTALLNSNNEIVDISI